MVALPSEPGMQSTSSNGRGRLSFSISLMCCDLLQIGAEIAALAPFVESFHLDVIDGSYSPRGGLPLALIADVRSITDRPVEVHLMVRDPVELAGAAAGAGASHVTVAATDAAGDAATAVAERRSNATLGIAVEPGQRLSEAVLAAVRPAKVTVMTVLPGGEGRPLLSDAYRRVGAVAAWLRCAGSAGTPVEVDGAVGPNTIGAFATAGATQFVLGSTVLAGRPRDASRIERLRDIAAGHDQERVVRGG